MINSLISPNHKMITLTGAGGKTSLSHWIASAATSSERKTLITTTTKIFPPLGVEIVIENNGPDFMGRLEKAFQRNSVVVAARHWNQYQCKFMGLSRATISSLYKASVVNLIIVEGDGAACKPLKAPLEHEPVVPMETDLSIAVYGLDAIYRPLTESLVHRHETFARLAGSLPNKTIIPEQIIRLTEAAEGSFKGTPERADRAVFLNKTDLPDSAKIINTFTDLLAKHDTHSNAGWYAGSTQKRTISRINQQAFIYDCNSQQQHSAKSA